MKPDEDSIVYFGMADARTWWRFLKGNWWALFAVGWGLRFLGFLFSLPRDGAISEKVITECVALLLWLGLALIPAEVAFRRGRNFLAWWFPSIILWPITLLVVLALPPIIAAAVNRANVPAEARREKRAAHHVVLVTCLLFCLGPCLKERPVPWPTVQSGILTVQYPPSWDPIDPLIIEDMNMVIFERPDAMYSVALVEPYCLDSGGLGPVSDCLYRNEVRIARESGNSLDWRGVSQWDDGTRRGYVAEFCVDGLDVGCEALVYVPISDDLMLLASWLGYESWVPASDDDWQNLRDLVRLARREEVD